MSCAKPILAANARALPELVEHGVNGFLFNPQNAESLADNIRAFLSMPERWAEMGQASLEQARPHQLQHTIKRYVEWYESVLGRSLMIRSRRASREQAPVIGGYEQSTEMAVFADQEQFYAVMQEVFDYVVRHPQHTETFTRSNLVIRMRTTEPDAEILLDGRQPPLEVFFGPTPGLANLEVAMPADLLHALWLGKESTHKAFYTGRIRTTGNLLKAMQLGEVFQEAERIYPTVARKYGLDGA
jgi:hypothetical protein